MILGDRKLPAFIGYLPPVVDGVLLELVNMSYKHYPPRRGRTGAQLAEERRLALDSLRLHFKNKPHRLATEIMAQAMRNHKPFCLYLRNFGLGQRVYHAADNGFEIPQVMTIGDRAFDGKMQGLIAAQVSPKIPALCIRNPSGDFLDLPGFIVGDDEWAELAQTLVRNAGLVVMYFLSLTSGVSEELDLIRGAGKQTNTLIVVEEDNPLENTSGLAAMFQAKRNEPPRIDGAMADFPHQVRRSGTEGWNTVEAELAEMLQGQLPAPVDKRIGLPVEYMPPEPLRKYCTDMATKEFDAAMTLSKAKQFEDAEDVLNRSIAYAHWARDTLGRAVTLMTLGRLNLTGFNAKGEAGAYYEMALDVCEEIRASSPTAAQVYAVVQQELGVLRAEAEAKGKANAR